VSSKNFKKAVERNRVKRLMRETYRLQKNSLQGELEKNQKYLAVFIIYTSKELPVFENLYATMQDLLQRLKKNVATNEDQK
jgi:ribonuclease P protein component